MSGYAWSPSTLSCTPFSDHSHFSDLVVKRVMTVHGTGVDSASTISEILSRVDALPTKVLALQPLIRIIQEGENDVEAPVTKRSINTKAKTANSNSTKPPDKPAMQSKAQRTLLQATANSGIASTRLAAALFRLDKSWSTLANGWSKFTTRCFENKGLLVGLAVGILLGMSCVHLGVSVVRLSISFIHFARRLLQNVFKLLAQHLAHLWA